MLKGSNITRGFKSFKMIRRQTRRLVLKNDQGAEPVIRGHTAHPRGLKVVLEALKIANIYIKVERSF